jgi:5-methylcytosine-specific restriction protein B
MASGRYFPKKMLLIFAGENKDALRKGLVDLYDEDKEVASRIDNFHRFIEGLLKKHNKKGGTSVSFVDLRFISALLSARYSKKYVEYKAREGTSFIKFIDEEFNGFRNVLWGEKYKIYQDYTEKLRKYLKKDPRIEKIRERMTKGLNFQDKGLAWVTQDAIFVVGRKLNDLKRDKDSSKEDNKLPDKFTDLIRNKKQIILYGPPGTGKTYKTKGLSISLINKHD